jgi:type IV pilus assembly protein PilY1
VQGDLYNATTNLIQVGTTAERATATAALYAAKGWVVQLGVGEKVVSGSVTIGGVVNFSTNTPGISSTCTSDLGVAKIYQVDPFTAAAVAENDGVSGYSTLDRYTNVQGGGLLPSPVPAIVEISGRKYQAVISGPNVLQIPSSDLEVREPTFWYKYSD